MLERMQKAINTLDAMRGDDPEREHSLAEGVLLDYLDSTGCGALADAFRRAEERLGFWYA